jgi:TonB-dependent SusC/RagA subfamily outer membrane receptor
MKIIFLYDAISFLNYNCFYMRKNLPPSGMLSRAIHFFKPGRYFDLEKITFILGFLLLTGFCLPSFAQNRLLSGTVTDPDGKALVGASITVKNSQVGTSTDADGKFSVNVPGSNAVLIVTSVGFTTQEVPVNGRSAIDIRMAQDATALKDVVVVGYGVQRKKSLTGAVVSVNEEQIRAIPVGNATSRLQGRVAGVTITNNNAPGAAATVRVRGYGSLGNNNPLYIIDNIPRTNMDNINPNDIESMTVLKDASSAAIYGSRAANGVIVVTTKRGKAGEPT